MPLGRGIVELFEAIPDRIEVSGHAPTWRVTGGSFDAVVAYSDEAFDDPTVVAREDRSRWWPRVTLTVTTDPALAAQAPPRESFADPVVPVQPSVPESGSGSDWEAGPVEADAAAANRAEADPVEVPPAPADEATEQEPAEPEYASTEQDQDEAEDWSDDDSLFTTLEEIFAHQEELRQARHRIPGQRGSGD